MIRLGILALSLLFAAGPGMSDPVFVSSDGMRFRAVADETVVELIGAFRTVKTPKAKPALIIYDHVDRFRLHADCHVSGDRLNGDGRLSILGDGFVIHLDSGRDLVFLAQPLSFPGLLDCQRP